MKRFQIEGEFDAENIDDAFEKLAEHFYELAVRGANAQVVFDYVSIEIKPV